VNRSVSKESQLVQVEFDLYRLRRFIGVGRGPSESDGVAERGRQLGERGRPIRMGRRGTRIVEESLRTRGGGRYLCDGKAARGCEGARCPIGGTPNSAWQVPVTK